MEMTDALLAYHEQHVSLAALATYTIDYPIPDECRRVTVALILADNNATAFTATFRIRKQTPSDGNFDLQAGSTLATLVVPGNAVATTLTSVAANVLRINAQAIAVVTSRFYWVIKMFS